MRAFWEPVLEPLLEALQPRRILEIGAQRGETTALLAEWASTHSGTVDTIDPAPEPELDAILDQYKVTLTHHPARSLEALPGIPPVDLALIDGDHNWYTVLNELRALAATARAAEARAPVIALHDVDWPYGRRDLYYEPDVIPAEHRHPYATEGLAPGDAGLVASGLNPLLANAQHEGGPANGVRTAVEDFQAESDEAWRLYEIPGEHGLGVLVTEARLGKRSKLRTALGEFEKPGFLRERARQIEIDRVELKIARQQAAEKASTRLRRIATLEEEAAELRAAASGTAAEQEDALSEVRDRLAAVLRERDALQSLGQDEERARDAAEELTTELRAVAEQRERLLRALASERTETELAGVERDALRRRLDELVSEREEVHQRIVELERVAAEHDVVLTRAIVAERRLQEELRRQAEPGPDIEAETIDSVAPEAAEPEPGELPAPGTPPPAGATPELAAAADPDPERDPRPVATPGHALPESVLPDAEQEARVAFRQAYADTSGSHEEDPLAAPIAADSRGVLVASDDPRSQAEGPTVDVVVCVHNALEDVQRCLWSLLHKGSHPFRLIVVNDGSDEETTAYLEGLVASEPAITVIHNVDAPHGYTIAANLGMREATGDYVVLLNSDTIATFGWIEHIVACGESRPGIGVLGPLSNAASHQSVPLLRDAGAWATNEPPAWLPIDGIAAAVSSLSTRQRPPLPFINGFCYAIKRAVIDTIGYFDEENFASGYCEENDFSYRASQAGFELAVVDDGYVYHAKSKSYSVEGRSVIAKRNYQVFLDKHGRSEIESLVAGMEADTALAPLRDAIETATASPANLAAALESHPAKALRIAFILPGLGEGGSGGSHSIYQEVRGLRELGVDARIMLPERVRARAQSAYSDAGRIFQLFDGPDELAEGTQDCDVICATHFKSVEMLADLCARRDGFLPAYYVQDYEPFFMAGHAPDADEALRSYTLVPNALLFAKTHWLCNIVRERHGVHVAKVEPSIDERLFVPIEGVPVRHRLRVTAMIRPRTPRRQPTLTARVLERVHEALGDEVEVVTFGCRLAELERVTDLRDLHASHAGLLTRDRVAELLARSDVFLDMSTYQAFGRTALEAMACGATAVVPRLGGAWEFVRQRENAIAIDTFDEDAAVEALLQLADDAERLESMQAAARATASRYSIVRAALSELLVLGTEHARRFGPVGVVGR